MGFRFRKSFNLGGGFRVNLSKSGIGYSWGTKGARFTKTAKGTTRTTTGIPGSGISYVTESAKPKAKHSSTKHKSGQQCPEERGSSMIWIDFIICLFFGFFGVHKFREKKIGMGLLYLFTVGLFGFGWIYDCIKYAIIALNASKNSTSFELDNVVNNFSLPENTSKILDILKKIGLWLLSSIFLLLALVLFPSLSSFIAIIVVLLIVPITKWQGFISKYIKSKIKIIAVVVLALSTLIFLPKSDPPKAEGPIYDTVISETEAPTSATEYESEEASKSSDNTNPTNISATEAEDAPVTDTTESIENTTADTVDHTTPSATEEPATTPHTHNFSPATCVAPKTCSDCGETEGDPSGHSWQDATCTTPKICTVCEETEGSANGHTWLQATCTSPETCSVCDETNGSTIDHNYSNGTCSSCGGSDPNYTSDTLVWIPTKGGKKYHTHAGCSNMDDPIQVTEEEAEARGFEPCKRCH